MTGLQSASLVGNVMFLHRFLRLFSMAMRATLSAQNKMGNAMGTLTTHVLDTGSGNPAERLKIELYRITGGREKLREVVTNADGRVDGPILEKEDFSKGSYELHFHAGDYLKSKGHDLPDPAFLDVIVIRFGIAETDQHYHVPLLLSPYGYSTYRGS